MVPSRLVLGHPWQISWCGTWGPVEMERLKEKEIYPQRRKTYTILRGRGGALGLSKLLGSWLKIQMVLSLWSEEATSIISSQYPTTESQ